jgi:hypothetical protein
MRDCLSATSSRMMSHAWAAVEIARGGAEIMCHPSVTLPLRKAQEGGTGRRPTLSPLRISQRLSGTNILVGWNDIHGMAERLKAILEAAKNVIRKRKVVPNSGRLDEARLTKLSPRVSCGCSDLKRLAKNGLGLLFSPRYLQACELNGTEFSRREGYDLSA